MNQQHDRIVALCEQLKLDRLGSEWPALAQDAANKEASFADFLEAVLNTERGIRDERKRITLSRLATMPSIKTLEQSTGAMPAVPPRRRSRNSVIWPSYNVPRTSCCSARAASARPTSRWRSLIVR